MSRRDYSRFGYPQISPKTGRPEWAGRVSRHKIVQLYETDARGIVDTELINEVGTWLLLRCESILMATEARRGRAVCPACRESIHHAGEADETLECRECGWQLAWSEYLTSLRKKQLWAGGIEDFLEEFVAKYPKAPTPRHRMILIDQLIHRYHWEMLKTPRRPGASNLIGGTLNEVTALLNSLMYGDQSTAGLRETHNRWRKQGRRLLRKLEKSGELEKAAPRKDEHT